MKRLTERIVALLIAVMTMTVQTAWAQEPGEPDLGRIICDPANVNGGSLSFYYSYDSEQQIEKRRILCGSPGDKDPWLNYAPGQPTDEKHLA